MARIKITFTHEHPGEKLSPAQVEEWLDYRLGISPTISADNPLALTRLTACERVDIHYADDKTKKKQTT